MIPSSDQSKWKSVLVKSDEHIEDRGNSYPNDPIILYVYLAAVEENKED